MRRALLVLPAALLLACADEAGPASDLTGRWTAQQVEASEVLDLVQRGRLLSGAGTYYRFINPPSSTFTVTGTYDRPDVVLSIHYDTGQTTTFQGVVAGPSRLAGVETYPGGGSDTLAFQRD